MGRKCILGTEKDKLIIRIFGEGNMGLELWKAKRFSDILAKFLDRDIEIVKG